MMDDDDDLDPVNTGYGPGTVINMSYAGLDMTIETAARWTPEMIETALTRLGRQLTKQARKLGMVPTEPTTGD